MKTSEFKNKVIRNYLIVLVSVTASIVTAISFNYISTHSSNKFAKIINAAGKQRLLSQKILTIALEQYSIDFAIESNDSLENAIDEFEVNHNFLLNSLSNIDFDSKKSLAQHLYWSKDKLNDRLLHFLAASNELKVSLKQKQIEEFIEEQKVILANLDNVVHQIEDFSNAQIGQNKTMLIFSLIGTLLIFLFLFYRIIRPNIKEQIKNYEEAKDLAKAKEQFLANMSHEMRTPLAGVMGSLILFEDANLENQQRELLEQIRSSGENLKKIIDETLDYSDLESGDLFVENKPFSILDLKNMILDKYKVSINEKGLNFIVNLDAPEESNLKGDKSRVFQIFDIILSNSLKFTNNGEILTTIKATSVPGQKTKLEATIKDTGAGIKPDYLESIFDEFSQFDANMDRAHGGTGLGMALAKKLVILFGGEIKIQSIEDIGTSVQFYLVLDSSEKTKVIKIVQKDFKKAISDTSNQHRVLIVEDNLMNQNILKKVLLSVGIVSDTAENGKIGVSKVLKAQADKQPYTLIFMDLQMPVMDGLTATKKIKQELRENSPTIVAVTANAFEKNKRACIDAGMVKIIKKPFSKKDIYEAINDINIYENKRNVS